MTTPKRAALPGVELPDTESECVELEYEDRGTGEPVVLIHAGLCARWFAPLTDQPTLSERYRLIRYHRAGYAGSTARRPSADLSGEAGHCLRLLDHLDVDRAHVVGHSSGAAIALQLALDAPDRVRSLALLEAALQQAPSGPEWSRTVFVPAMERYRAGDRAGAVDTFLRGVCGPGYRRVLERAVPGAFDEAVRDAGTFFGHELSIVRQWTFGAREAGRLTRPVLAVMGELSEQLSPIWGERHKLLLSWIPHAEPFVLPGATHLLHAQNPRGTAEALAAFFTRSTDER
ncbi:alpha/beta fold hydrolase [Nonomuraea rhizosphaerae]|uniref:alpha/beta fold hydrolase n=1 Tax=Nonomuraea rhizosphaerae TaxID=2665663 RepID=UPI001C5F164E|nr:alpha/beta hydrolase [Nonomuraea rhizosphaerae]